MNENKPLGCEYCRDPVTVSMNEKPIKRINENIYIVECPKCGTLILDDWLGWKGSGVGFHATEEMIEDYIQRL